VNPRVHIERWVITDLFALPLSRPSKLKFLNDLLNHLPANHPRLCGNRCEKNPACFWYERLTKEGIKVHPGARSRAITCRTVRACKPRRSGTLR
jgi:hypothetical protein